MRISVVTGDLTQLQVDVFVNAANAQLARGSGVCGAIFRAAGPGLEAACEAVAPCPTGEARITPGFASKARWIVHAVGPVWRGGNDGEPELLASAYRTSLVLARDAGAASIAFPAISTGVYGYPIRLATQVAVLTVGAWCEREPRPEHIIFCCFSAADCLVYEETIGTSNQ